MKLYKVLTLGLAAGIALAGPPAPGVSNFHQVNSRVYRGAQPDSRGFESLARLGVREVIDLRGGSQRSEAEKKAVEAAGMKYLNLPMQGLRTPSDETVSRALAELENDSAGPVFVHCKRGKDRTGTVIACYRIAHDQWVNQKALDEAKSLGMSWIQRGMRGYILHYGVRGEPASQVGLTPVRAAQ